jgi:putative AlgH/UPF0301 family transcriptional regulator
MRLLAAAALLVASIMTARAADLSAPLVLVASTQLVGPYANTVLIVLPAGTDRHLGFILNRPTKTQLAELLPEHPAAKRISAPVFYGGPHVLGPVFALVRAPSAPAAGSIEVLPDLYLALGDGEVEEVILGAADTARFYVGLVTWERGELAAELGAGAWHALAADADLVLDASAETLWVRLIARLSAFTRVHGRPVIHSHYAWTY